jgi:hypothetical protein
MLLQRSIRNMLFVLKELNSFFYLKKIIKFVIILFFSSPLCFYIGALSLKPLFMDDKKVPTEDVPSNINLLNEFHAHVINPESIPGGEITDINETEIGDIT